MSAVDIAQIANGWAAVVTSCLALIAGVVAIAQLRANRRVQREASAYEIFRDYMKLAFDHPQYSRPDFQAISKDPRSLEQYSWYVGCLLWAADEVIQCTTLTKAWTNTLLGHIALHSDFLLSDQFRAEDFKHHSDELQQMITKVCRQPDAGKQTSPGTGLAA
jgi:hypothetical protein